MGFGFPLVPYPNWRFRSIDNPAGQFAIGSVPSRPGPNTMVRNCCYTLCCPTSHRLPYTTSLRLLVTGICNSANLWIKYAVEYIGSYSQVKIGSVFPLISILRSAEPVKWGVYNWVQLSMYFRVCLEVYLRISPELTLEHTLKQAGSVPSSAIGRVLESMPGSGLQVYSESTCSVLWGLLDNISQAGWECCHEEQLGIYSQTGWVCAIEWNQEYTSKRTWHVHQVYLAACLQVCCMQCDV